MFNFMVYSKNRQRSLRGTAGPAGGFTHRGKGVSMEWRRPMQAQGFEMVGSAVAFVAREAVLRVDGVPLLHARVAVRFREDGSGGDGNAAGVAFDQGFLLDQNVELHGVDEQIVWRNSELLERGGHGLARGLVNIPGVDALRVDFSDGPAQRVLLDTDGQLGAAFSGKFFRVVEADDAPLGIENHRGGDDGAKQRAASGFINAGDAQPAGQRRMFERISFRTVCEEAPRAMRLPISGVCCATRNPTTP